MSSFCIGWIPARVAAQSGTVVEQAIPRQQAMEMLASGSRWAVVKGTMQPDGNFLAKEIDIIHAEESRRARKVDLDGWLQVHFPGRILKEVRIP